MDVLARRLLGGCRTSLSKAITLTESSKWEHRGVVQDLFTTLQQHKATHGCKSLRIGICGSPGSGKSSFIERYGTHLVNQGEKVAVLAIDPSSSRSGGSILGDRTRMEQLSRLPNAYIRPSPSKCHLGGVGAHTHEAIELCESAGFENVIVETVGLGQSEIEIRQMVDVVLLLVAPGSGDDLQGMKKGIVEIADLIVVTKCDGERVGQGNKTMVDYMHALQLLGGSDGGSWKAKVVQSSTEVEGGLDKVLGELEEFKKTVSVEELLERRVGQRHEQMWMTIQYDIMRAVRKDPRVLQLLPELEQGLDSNQIFPRYAAAQIVDTFVNK